MDLQYSSTAALSTIFGRYTSESVLAGCDDRREKKLPASLDLFGWCTWDAYYFRVSAQGIMEGLRSFKQGGVQPRFLVIDDGGVSFPHVGSYVVLCSAEHQQQPVGTVCCLVGIISARQILLLCVCAVLCGRKQLC